MKNIFFVVITILLSSLGSHAQEQLPAEQKVVFGQNGEMFINKDLGVYFWLSTSPDENAPKHRLQSDSSKKYSNPMYFDTEGYNTFRSPSCVDTVTKKTVLPERDVIFEVYADGLAPHSVYKLVSGKSITRSGKQFLGSNPVMKLSATDAVSGIEKTYYSINAKPYTEYKDSLKLDLEGETVLRFYSTDRVGNRERPAEKTFYVDNSAPTTSYEILGNTNEKFVSPNATIKLISSDKMAGVKAIYYQINNGTRQLYAAPIPVKLLADSGSMSFYAVDYLDNKEALQVIGGNGNALNIQTEGTFEFYVDNDPPSFELEFQGSNSKGTYQYVSGKTKLKVNAEDQKSGVDKVFYSINNTKVETPYAEGIEFDAEGIAYVRINAVDNVGNQSATLTNAYFVDTQGPVTKASISLPKKQVKDSIFITASTKISLAATDNASGLNQISYAIGNQPAQVYTQAFTLKENGIVTIQYFSTDKVDNQETPNTMKLFVDNNPPLIYQHFSSPPIGSKTVREEGLTIYPANVQLYVAATDQESGGEKVEYTINGGAIKSVNPIKDFLPGNYEVIIKAYDVLGNVSTETVKFAIEK